MKLLELDYLQHNQKVLGLIALAIGIGAWTMELSGAVYICPYCRIQRTVIAILGLIMLFPNHRAWIVKYLAAVVGFMGAVVAVNQNFMGWIKISKGEFVFREQLYIDPFLLSGGALFLIIGQLWIILHPVSTTK